MPMLPYKRYAAFLMLVLIARKLYNTYIRKKYNYPPGECGLPIIGNLLSIYFRGDNYFKSLAKKYNGICMIQFGTKNCILVNDYSLFKINFKKKEFQQHDQFCNGITTFVDLNGDEMWKRRAILHESFTQLLNWKSLHSYIKSNRITNTITPGENINLFNILDYYVFSMIFTCVFGTEYIALPTVNSQQYKYYNETMHTIHDTIMYGTLFAILFGSNNLYGKYGTFPAAQTKLVGILKQWIYEYEIAISNNDKSNTLSSSNECTAKILLDKINNFDDEYTKQMMVEALVEIFIGATASVVRIMTHCLIKASKYNDIQDILFSELKNQPLLNYVEFLKLNNFRAFIFETLRLVTAPFGIPRSIKVNNLQLNEYNLPKDSFILPTYYHTMLRYQNARQINYFDFNLNNFLVVNKKNNKKQFQQNPVFKNCIFGFGPRNCPGQTLALRMLYLLVSHLLKQYRFELSEKSRHVKVPTDLTDKTVQTFTFNVYER